MRIVKKVLRAAADLGASANSTTDAVDCLGATMVVVHLKATNSAQLSTVVVQGSIDGTTFGGATRYRLTLSGSLAALDLSAQGGSLGDVTYAFSATSIREGPIPCKQINLLITNGASQINGLSVDAYVFFDSGVSGQKAFNVDAG